MTKLNVKPTKITLNSDPAELRAALSKVGVKVRGNTKDAILSKFAQVPHLTTPNTKVPVVYKMKYGKDANNGDDVADLLKEADLSTVAHDNGIDLSRWAGKNNGMIRMNLGNVLRGRIRRGEKVKIGNKTFN